MKSRELKIALVAAAITLALGGAAIFGFRHDNMGGGYGQPPAPLDRVNVITTVFWAGEPADADNGNISNFASAWDEQWQTHYGGFDDPNHRDGYFPAGFTPKENPFYVALPYNDISHGDARKSSADNCRIWQPQPDTRYSYCKNIWVAITTDSKTAYAQWEDVGPFQEDDASYVFGSALPANTEGEHAGLDVSPAVRDFLELQDVDTTTWRFVRAEDVPDGPWKAVVSSSKGNAL